MAPKMQGQRRVNALPHDHLLSQAMKEDYKPLPSLRLLEDLFVLKGGTLVWRIDRGGKAKAGTQAGSPHKNGRLAVKVLGKQYYVHRIVWALTHGEDPGPLQIDHRDRNPLNNDPSNLRLATKSQNGHNRPARGYWWNPHNRRFYAKIAANGTHTYLGCFKTEAEARAAYLAAIEQHHGEFACDLTP
jgi:hypothetical protein